MNIDVICNIIKVINVVETSKLSKERGKYVKTTRHYKLDSLLERYTTDSNVERTFY